MCLDLMMIVPSSYKLLFHVFPRCGLLTCDKVAYGGYFPRVDVDGQPFTGHRAAKAGKKLRGGPYALVSIRWMMNL